MAYIWYVKETIFPSYSEAVSYIKGLVSAEGVSMKRTGAGDERVVFEDIPDDRLEIIKQAVIKKQSKAKRVLSKITKNMVIRLSCTCGATQLLTNSDKKLLAPKCKCAPDALTVDDVMDRIGWLTCRKCGSAMSDVRVEERAAINNSRNFQYEALIGSDVFHKAGCGWLDNSEMGSVRGFDSREAAIRAGYRPCTSCKP